MKRIVNISLVFAVLLMFAGISAVMAQEPPHPPAEHGLLDDKQPGNGNCSAPLNGGVSILVTLGIAYGVMRLRSSGKKETT